MIKQIIVATVNLLFLGSPAISQNSEQQLQLNNFENQLVNNVNEDSIGSISGAVLFHDKLIWSKAFGLANPISKVSADTSTIYRIGSITKTFTAFLMMQMIEKGYFKLDDPIEKYLPEIKGLKGYSDSTIITFRHLASHTSGLPRHPALESAQAGPITEWENKVLQSIPTISFLSKPGEKYSYSNIGYGILGLAISRATNQSFIQLVIENIFVPLNMTNSFFIVPANDTSRLSLGVNGGPLDKKDIEIPYGEHKGRGYKVPNGGIYSTPNDLVKFIRELMGTSDKKIISAESRKLMEALQTPNSKKNGYGLGLSINKTDDNLIFMGHEGSVAGYTSYFCFDILNNSAVILLRNYNSGKTNLVESSKTLLRQLSKN